MRYTSIFAIHSRHDALLLLLVDVLPIVVESREDVERFTQAGMQLGCLHIASVVALVVLQQLVYIQTLGSAQICKHSQFLEKCGIPVTHMENPVKNPGDL